MKKKKTAIYLTNYILFSVALKRGLVVSDQEKRGLYALDLDDDAAFRIPVFGHASPRDIAFDRDADLAFWVDSTHKFVASACVMTSCAKVIKRFVEDGMLMYFNA